MIRLFALIVIIGSSCSTSQQVSTQNVKEVFPVYASAQEFSISNPIVSVDSMIFSKSAAFSFLSPVDGSYITYAVDEEPTRDSKKADGIVSISKSGSVNAKAFHPDYKPSDVVTVEIKKVNYSVPLTKVEISPSPNEKYASTGVGVLTDKKRGSLNFGNGDWLGFNDQSVVITVEADDANVSSISIGILRNQGGWIFAPRDITVFSDGVEVGSIEIEDADRPNDPGVELYTIDLDDDVKASLIQINISSLSAIPDWHPGKGTNPWTFIDEIIIE